MCKPNWKGRAERSRASLPAIHQIHDKFFMKRWASFTIRPSPTTDPDLYNFCTRGAFWSESHKNHLFSPSGPKRSGVVRYFLWFFKHIFHLAALKKPARKCFRVPKDAKLRARRPRVGILELPRGISTVRANTSYRRPISKIFFNAQLGQKF